MNPLGHDGGKHRRAELRSIALHRAVAERLRERPDLLQKAVLRVEEWQATPLAHPYGAGWAARLAGPLPELLEFMVSDTEAGRAYRQASPFAGILSPRERWRVLKELDS